MYKLLSFTGLIYGCIGLVIVFFDNIKLDLSNISLIGVIVLFVGILITILSALASSFVGIHNDSLKSKTDIRVANDFRAVFITSWSTLEAEARDITSSMGSKPELNIRTLFEKLKEVNLLSSDDLQQIYKLMRYRNNIVHGMKEEYTKEELKAALNEVEALIEKLT